jgi:hypothetical protein
MRLIMLNFQNDFMPGSHNWRRKNGCLTQEWNSFYSWIYVNWMWIITQNI